MSINDAIYSTIEEDGSLNDRLFTQLRGEGYTGSLNDMLAQAGGFKTYIDNLIGSVTRYFTTFDSVANTQIDLSSAITLTGDFEIELDFIYSASPTSAISILGGDLASSYIRFDSTTTFKLGTAGGNVFITISPALDYDKLNTMRLVKDGTTHTLYLNDVNVGSNTGTSSNFEVTQIGSKAGGSHFDGVISDVKIWDGGDRDTGTLVLDMPIDAQYGTDTSVTDESGNNSGTAVNFVDADSEFFTEQSDGDWLGEELWISGAGVSNGSEGTVQTLITNPAGQTETGKTYQIVNTVTNLTAGEMSSTLKGKGWGYTSDGVYTEIWTAVGGGDVVRTGNTQPNSGASLLPSFKRILELP